MFQVVLKSLGTTYLAKSSYNDVTQFLILIHKLFYILLFLNRYEAVLQKIFVECNCLPLFAKKNPNNLQMCRAINQVNFRKDYSRIKIIRSDW
jgi:hypothetical protein